MNELIDLALIAILLFMALLSVLSAVLFKAIIFFILLGLILAMVWIRLDAPDIALAEAAIGAGITGILFLNAQAQLPPQHTQAYTVSMFKQSRFWFALIASLSTMIVLTLAVNQPLNPTITINQPVFEQLTASGVSHPITAILLNYRSFDTLLEIAVLVQVAVIALSLRQHEYVKIYSPTLPNPLLHACLTLFLPMLFLVSMYLLWVGASQPGGAFQAGSVLAAVFILFYLAGFNKPINNHERYLKLGWVFGLSVFLMVGILTLFTGDALLAYPLEFAGVSIFFIEFAVTLSIGWILFSLFVLSQNIPYPSVKENNE